MVTMPSLSPVEAEIADSNNEASVLMVPVATERLLGGSMAPTSISAMTSVPPPPLNFATPNTTTSEVDADDLSPHTSPSMGRWAAHAPLIPKDLERIIKIKKGADQLGVNIEVVDHGINGVVVSSLVRNGAVHKDGRLHAGDFILSVNNESMRNITNSQARAILRRTQLVSTDVSINYIPGQDAAVHREASLLQYQQQQQQQLQEERQTPLQHQTSPRSPYIPCDSSEEEATAVGEASQGDLTRSITAPSFITRELRSRDPSHEDLLGSNLVPTNHIEEGDAPEALTVIKIKHALSETSIEKRTEDNVSSVLISGDNNRQTGFSGNFEDGSEEGPFTITFKNVSEAQSEFSTSTEELQAADDRPVADDHEVDGVLHDDSIRSSASSPGPNLQGKHWGPERSVEVHRDDKNSLGISIVGGKVDLSWSESSVTGIFIKNVLPSSPAGKSGLLKTGDRILEVEGQDLRGATHEKAVEIIKKTGNPVNFKVQSLVQWTPANTPVNSRPPSRNISTGGSYLTAHTPKDIPVNRTPSPELIQAGLSDVKKAEIQNNIGHPRLNRRETTESLGSIDSDDGLDPNDERYEQGRIEAKSGVEIDRASAGAIRRTKADRQADTEDEDEFGYTKKKIMKKYGELKGEVVMVEITKGQSGLGISLAGHTDRTKMSAFICGMNPNGIAHKQDKLKVGDEILEVNGNVLFNRCHLNACAIFQGIAGPALKIIVLRKKSGQSEMAVKPLTNFPVVLEDEAPEDRYANYQGLSNVVIKKGTGGMGIMIIEGKHAKYGKGIFISDLQEGSPADEGGLKVGDMILCVNKDDMSQVDYEKATEILKRTEGVVKVWVCNAARDPSAPQEKKKPDVPPKPAIAPKPTIPTKPILPLTTTTQSAVSHSPTTLSPTTLSPTTPPSTILNNKNDLNNSQTTPTTQSHQYPPSEIHPENLSPLQRNNSYGMSSNTTSWSTSNSEPPTITTIENKAPATDPITPGYETTIEITKEKMGLGLSIVGGSDTLLGAIIIHEVYPDGAAAKDGRLKPGDQILNVNTENFREITHQKALSVLRQTPSK
ncbi:unnamed protein product, partial [Meganyctiphanes norvegica]